jgi:hypothetical protein
MKMKKIKNLIWFILAILVLVVLAFTIFILFFQKQQNNKDDDRIYCSVFSRDADICIQMYEPVCGYPQKKTYSNSCSACREKNVEYYFSGEC